MTTPVDVAIVGAGPYGLSLGAHLHAAGIRFRLFGLPMRSWREAMPRGMLLASAGAAATLSDPGGEHTPAAFLAATGRNRDHHETGHRAGPETGPETGPQVTVPRETFVAYGTWFARRLVPELEELTVTAVTRPGAHYVLTLCDGSRAVAHRVVMAIGMQHFAYTPSLLATLPSRVCTHNSAHPDLGVFRDTEVVVVGAGQSALESAALLHEGGARVTLVARTPALRWQPDPRSPAPRSGGSAAAESSGWADWFYSTRPNLFRLLPATRRVQIARTAWGPSGTHWLRSRVVGRFPALVGHAVRWAEPEPWGVRLGLQVAGAEISEITAEHVLAATGYRTELSRVSILDRGLRAAVRTVAGTPDVGPDFQSSVPGLYFIGPAVAPTFGPVMRLLRGADYAARTVTHWLVATGRGQRGRRVAGRNRLTAAGSPRSGT